MAFQYYNGQLLTLDGASIDGPRQLPGFSGMTPLSLETDYLGTIAISGTQNVIPLNLDGPFPIGFNFPFFGDINTQFWICENGYITFNDPSDNYNTAVSIPDASSPNNFIAAHWTNLTIHASGSIQYATIGIVPNRKCIIQFENHNIYSPPTYLGTFYIILHETGKIQIQYRQLVLNYSSAGAISHGSASAIGIENSTGTAGIQYSYREPSAIIEGQAITFTPSASTYILNRDAFYDNVYLSSTYPTVKPKLTTNLSPYHNSTVGSRCTFKWKSSKGATTYSLLYGTSSSLGGATVLQNLTSTSYTLDLSVNRIYYWGVLPNNNVNVWMNVYKFDTSTGMITPLSAVPYIVDMFQNQANVVQLLSTDVSDNSKTAIITSVPQQGELHQYIDGSTIGDWIYHYPTPVTDPSMRVFYVACGSTGNRAGSFSYKVYDGSTYSRDASITINVLPL